VSEWWSGERQRENRFRVYREAPGFRPGPCWSGGIGGWEGGGTEGNVLAPSWSSVLTVVTCLAPPGSGSRGGALWRTCPAAALSGVALSLGFGGLLATSLVGCHAHVTRMRAQSALDVAAVARRGQARAKARCLLIHAEASLSHVIASNICQALPHQVRRVHVSAAVGQLLDDTDVKVSSRGDQRRVAGAYTRSLFSST